MNKYIRARRIQRIAAMNKIVTSSAEESLDRAVAMSPEERGQFLADFVRKSGVTGVIQALKRIVGQLTSAKKQAAMYEGFNETPQPPTDSRLRTILKQGDWEVVLIFLLMLALVNENYPFEYGPGGVDWIDELKAFLLATGGAFFAWVVKKLTSFSR